MSHRRHALFPDGLSDEAATALRDFFFQLATTWESHYRVRLRRHFDRQRNLYDPEKPWRFPPSDPRSR